MKKKPMMLIATTAMTIMIFLSCLISSNAKEVCTGHQYVWTYTETTFERLYAHSHYKEKNGRLDYWPCIVYQKYDHYKLHCLNCGSIIETKKEKREIVHNDAY